MGRPFSFLVGELLFPLVFFEAGWAESAVFDGGLAVVDEDVWASGDKLAVEEAAVSGGSSAAFTDGFELFDVFGDLEEAGRAFEAAVVLAEVEAETIGDNRDVEINSDERELVGLFWG